MQEHKPVAGRHYGMDWLRIGAFMLLIGYHVGLAFSPWGFELKSDKTADWVAMPLLALNAWRLSLLFAISGYASAALFAKLERPGRFARERAARLGIPLIFGMLVLVTPQPWVALVTQHGYPHDFWYFLTHDYFRPQDMDGVMVPTWMHLWFVVYLMVYTAIACLALLLPRAVRAAAGRGASWLLAGPLLLPLPILYIFLARQLPNGWTDSHALVDDPAAHLVYGAMFAFGWLLRGSENLRRVIAGQWKIAAVLAVVSTAGVVGVEHTWPGDTPLPEQYWPPFLVTRACQAWATIIALFGIADRFWNRDHRWRATLAEGVFPFYIIHQTIILIAGYFMLMWDWPMAAQFAYLIATTAIGCWLFYWVGRNIGPLRPLIGLKRHRAPPASPIVRPEATLGE